MALADLLRDTAKRLLPLAVRRRLRSWGVRLFPGLRYPWWIAGRVRQRRDEYPAPAVPGLFSLLTPVFDTPPRFLRALADSVLGQDYPDFEWVLVDNGSTAAGTLALLRRLARDTRVRLVRRETNGGILAGTRAALAAARGRYVVPVDHDDRLYPDALRILGWHLDAHGYPAAAYSDEDKLLPAGRPWRPFCKPDWDPLLLLNCCYPAHLAAFDREVITALGAYTDPAAEGCPDWDVFLRLARAGVTPLHVPEVLYSWRMHPGSTADPHSGAKPYTVAGQYHVLSDHLRRLGLDDRLEVRSNPLLRHPGLWRVARRHVDPTPPIHLVLLGDQPAPATTYPNLHVHACRALSDFIPHPSSLIPDFVAVLRADRRPLAADWPWEALGLFELLPDAAVVGGRVVDDRGRVVSAGEAFGVGGLLGCPFRGQPGASPRRHGLVLCQRTVSAVDAGFFVARGDFLAGVLAGRGCTSPELLGAWLGAAARRQGLRVVYSPHLLARAQTGPEPLTSDEEIWEFLREHWPLLGDDLYYSRFCSLRPGRGWQITPPQERAAVLNATLSRLAGPLPYLSAIKVPGDRYPPRAPVRAAAPAPVPG